MTSNAQLLETMVASLVNKLEMAKQICGNREAAIEYVRNTTTAGPKAWEIALRLFA